MHLILCMSCHTYVYEISNMIPNFWLFLIFVWSITVPLWSIIKTMFVLYCVYVLKKLGIFLRLCHASNFGTWLYIYSCFGFLDPPKSHLAPKPFVLGLIEFVVFCVHMWIRDIFDITWIYLKFVGLIYVV